MKKLLITGLLAASAINLAFADDNRREIYASGQGEISIAPDQATLSFAVEARDKELNNARQQVNKVVSRTLAIADQLGIDRKHVTSSHSNIRPEYSHQYKTNERRFTGYFVNRQVSIFLEDITLLGAVTEKLLDAGINNVNSPRFSHSQEDQLRRDALAAAATDARKNAQAMAQALGHGVGDTLSLSSSFQLQAPSPMQARMKVAAASFAESAPANSYASGQIVINATVSAQFELK